MEFKGNKNVEELSDLLKDESPRCAVIVAAAYFDEKLAEKLGDTTERSFAARINDALAWSLLTQNEHDDLHVLRKLRNDFAHDLRVKDFDANSSEMVAALKLWTTGKSDLNVEDSIKTAQLMLRWVVFVIACRLERRTKQKIGPLPEPPTTDIDEWPPHQLV
jgi:hypothetical protein